jgi:hypothetical protein
MLCDGGTRDQQENDGLVVHYLCDKRGEREAARLVLAWQDKRLLAVTNLIPREKAELTHDEHKAVLADFKSAVLDRIANLTVTLTSGDVRMQYLMSEAAYEHLIAFSRSANRMLGHPSDHDRWEQFIVALHFDGHSLKTDILRDWLIKVEGWQFEQISRKLDEFEFGLRLLERYDEHTA